MTIYDKTAEKDMSRGVVSGRPVQCVPRGPWEKHKQITGREMPLLSEIGRIYLMFFSPDELRTARSPGE